MGDSFWKDMERLNHSMVEMGALCESVIASAVQALLEQDIGDAARAVRLEEEIDKREKEIEQLCLRLMLHQPDASVLRQISAALKMITDMERIGDQAADIAEIAMLGNITPADDTTTIRDMSLAAIGMVTDCVEAYIHQDLALARKVVADDNLVDNLFNNAKADFADTLIAHPDKAECVIDLLLISKYLERIGDHAVNVAQWVVFAVLGRHEEEEADPA